VVRFSDPKHISSILKNVNGVVPTPAMWERGGLQRQSGESLVW